VGRKIADCAPLFAYGRQDAFPVDVWVLKALRTLYFPKRQPSSKRPMHFAATYFGPNAEYAQQYLFHYVLQRRCRRRGRGAAKQNDDQQKSEAAGPPAGPLNHDEAAPDARSHGVFLPPLAAVCPGQRKQPKPALSAVQHGRMLELQLTAPGEDIWGDFIKRTTAQIR
jgi:hypothetical protein